MPTRRLLVRTVWLALPVTITLLVLAVFNHLTIRAALLAWVLGLVLSSVLAWRRERRLQETRGYLAALAEGREPPPLPEFGPLGGDELATVLHRLDRALSEERERRAETDRWLRALLDALPDPLLVVDDGRVVASANPAATRLFGHDPVGKLLEASLRDPGVLAAVDQALRGHGAAQLNLHLPGPPPRAFGVEIVPIRLRARAAALIGLRELTEQLMIERMRSDFVANASHELRTPLAALSGFIETLAGPARDDPEARARFLKTMGAEAARMTRLVNDLLSLSRIEASEHQFPSERVDMIACLETVVDTLQPYAAEPQRGPGAALAGTTAGDCRRSRSADPAAHQPDRQCDQVRRRGRPRRDRLRASGGRTARRRPAERPADGPGRGRGPRAGDRP